MSEFAWVSTFINRSVDDVYRFAADPENLPQWAAGLSSSISRVGDEWHADSPLGSIAVRFAPSNDFGVLDHWVTLPGGDVAYNAVRVFADGSGSQVIFAVRRSDGMSDDEFSADAAAVRADLETLKALLE